MLLLDQEMPGVHSLIGERLDFWDSNQPVTNHSQLGWISVSHLLISLCSTNSLMYHRKLPAKVFLDSFGRAQRNHISPPALSLPTTSLCSHQRLGEGQNVLREGGIILRKFFACKYQSSANCFLWINPFSPSYFSWSFLNVSAHCVLD